MEKTRSDDLIFLNDIEHYLLCRGFTGAASWKIAADLELPPETVSNYLLELRRENVVLNGDERKINPQTGRPQRVLIHSAYAHPDVLAAL